MKISYNWLKQYVDLDYSPKELSQILTNTGLEMGDPVKVESVKGGLQGVVVGKVLSCRKHPNADRLSITTVDTGEREPLPIVCGAPNVAEGQKVLVATVGTTLYPENDNPFTIKETRIRGAVSKGMICAEDELGLGPSHKGIMVLDDDKEAGKPATSYFEIEEDWTLEIDLTPNRADATSHIGVARDVVAVTNRMKGANTTRLKYPTVEHFNIDETGLHIPVKINEPEACPRYSALSMKGLTIKDSPRWLQNKLKAAGLRPVNNVVDATNYVMLETGQPLHSFDANRIEGGKVIVKKMPEGTPFTTLDGIERTLSKEDLMICDARKPLCIAGVFGGAGSGVSRNTSNIFLESAYFHPVSIRKTAKRHQLKTDASFRFERGADPNITLFALKRAAMLIKDIAGGKISSPLLDENPGNLQAWQVTLLYKKLDRIAGIPIERTLIPRIIEDLGMDVFEKSEDKITVSVPTFKVDITRDVDLIEEILRIYGYNAIPLPRQMKIALSSSEKPERDTLTNIVSDFLSANGFAETINNSLTSSRNAVLSDTINDDHFVHILNPLSTELNVLRQDLISGGLENIKHNINRQIPDMMFYETGKTYHKIPGISNTANVPERFKEVHHLGIFLTGRKAKESWNTSDAVFNFYDIKYWVHMIFQRLGIDPGRFSTDKATRNYFTEGLLYRKGKQEIAQLGKLNRKTLQAFDIEQDVFYADIIWEHVIPMTKENAIHYQPLPKFPEVRRDLAMILDKNISFENIRTLAFEKERKILKEVRLFDIYEGENVPEGKKSYAISFILQDQEKTLTDKRIDKAMKKLQQAFEEKLNARIRG
ncbi:MAG: phenylalanine--tRNA ligase subunit beta [Bacteroidales bacterium]